MQSQDLQPGISGEKKRLLGKRHNAVCAIIDFESGIQSPFSGFHYQ